MSPIPQQFTLNVAPEKLTWITDRVKTAQVIPDIRHPKGREWDHGIPSSTMQDLVDYWRDSYDWKKVEERINLTFKMFTVDIEEGEETLNVHFVHHRSSRDGAIPLLFVHGWPGNFLEVESLLDLTEPKDPRQQAFHIVAPSIPGFVFSSAPQSPEFSVARIASVFDNLMKILGYSHYTGQGGDWGSFILRALAANFPKSCVGIHLNFVPDLPPSPIKSPLTILWLVLGWVTPDEKARLGRMQWWMSRESGYSQIQENKPQTISYALMDSPIGMLAWIREKMEVLVDGFAWPKETVITWTMVYLLSGNAGTARIYRQSSLEVLKKEILAKKISREVYFGASCFPRDVGYVPQWWAKATIAENIVSWKEHQKGGHFPSIECSNVLTRDIHEFHRKITGKRLEELRKAGL
ncbi:hypothetical protein DXG03_003212 [Asterophora parasitica]|uniref:Epoxide hydrolase N-terminal domain-containing protein n=1 Tax=Asterophora parasitica TaxID=117018 RepID=A0A9P7KIC6_9AGAR|nr:hypothetical protein DXG03_003212 [Asterophora parasitica]